jgi:hypothetical protein
MYLYEFYTWPVGSAPAFVLEARGDEWLSNAVA